MTRTSSDIFLFVLFSFLFCFFFLRSSPSINPTSILMVDHIITVFWTKEQANFRRWQNAHSHAPYSKSKKLLQQLNIYELTITVEHSIRRRWPLWCSLDDFSYSYKLYKHLKKGIMMCINKNVYLPKMESSVYGWERSENNLNNSYSTGAFQTDNNHIMPIF